MTTAPDPPTYTIEAHERVLVNAIKAKQDPHSAVYCWLNGIPYEPIGGAKRAQVKSLSFQMLYSPQFWNKYEKELKPDLTKPLGPT